MFFTGKPLLVHEVDEEENIYIINLLLCIQAICSGLILFCCYVSFLYMPFGDAMTIIFTAPIFTMVLSKIFLNDTCKLYKLICAMALLSGVTLVLQPPFIFDKMEVLPTKENGKYYFGASMAFASSIAGGFHYVIVGRLLRNSTTNSALLLAFYGGFGGLLVLLPVVYLDDNQRIFSTNIVNISGQTWAELSAIAVLGLIGFVTINVSMKHIKPIYVSFVSVSEIVLAYIAQIVVFSMVPNVFGIVGSLIVILAVCALPLETIISEKLPSSLRPIF
jgi:drug/metabolite transporter (DMT)-like permease